MWYGKKMRSSKALVSGLRIEGHFLIPMFLAVLLSSGLAEAAQSDSPPAPGEARVVLVATNPAGQPVPDVAFELESVGGEDDHNGVTDRNGEYILVLPQGSKYRVTCTHEGAPFDFGVHEIPSAATGLAYTLNLQLITTSIAPQEIRDAPPDGSTRPTQTVVTVMNSDGEREPDALVTLDSLKGDIKVQRRTNSEGQFELELPRGRTFKISCVKYEVTFDLGTRPLPAVDKLRLDLTLILDRSVFAMADAKLGASQADTLVTVAVVDKHGNPESEARISLTDTMTRAKRVGTSDSSGRFVFLTPRARRYSIVVEKYGVTFDAGEHKVPDVDAYEIDVQVSLATDYLETFRLENVYFDTDKATLRSESFAPLDQLFAALSTHPSMVIELAGHTDSRGVDAYNLKLSRARANSVRDYLVGKGIEPKRLAAKGYGETEPVASNDTQQGRQLNRRTEVRIIRR